ncbi:MAG: Asp-tRNA(Asn)/Glu-tRNA(Gln) amidotransferase subunit GatB [Anaerolineaceae bacterium]|nr:Asp-tRNA(Asn)/Glu-tRNA(Gln) amidotransferase subunit GatB [Anaerolineaceae bacterium]
MVHCRAMSDWIPVIGLEVHAELETGSKMFSPCPVVDSVEAAPNSAVDVVSLGLPGTLPVINRRAMEYGMMVGLALNCEIPPVNRFDRKSYFYPDLPKGYQISQYEHPLAINGHVDIGLADGRCKRIRVRRAHMEEDTGKLTHVAGGFSLVDYNRAGVPLLEIVTEPDLASAAEAEAFARDLRAILRWLGVNSGDMSKGVLRFEANVSLRQPDDPDLRTRTEIKNLNSIRHMTRAIESELRRQRRLYEKGEELRQATLGWDEDAQRIVVQRYKERADEYRYFPEPDLPVVEVSEAWVHEVRARIPEMPAARRQRFMDEQGLQAADAQQLTSERAVADFYEAVLESGIEAQVAANWICGALFALMNARETPRETIGELRFGAAAFAALLRMVVDGTLNRGTATAVLEAMWESGADPQQIVRERGLAQISDSDVIEETVDQVLAQQVQLVERYRAGETKLLGALMGQAMKALRGQGNPAAVRQALQQRLDV